MSTFQNQEHLTKWHKKFYILLSLISLTSHVKRWVCVFQVAELREAKLGPILKSDANLVYGFLRGARIATMQRSV